MAALKDNLVGSWRLVKYEELPVDGSPTTYPLGDRPKGYIIYSTDGYMAALLSSTDVTSLARICSRLNLFAVRAGLGARRGRSVAAYAAQR